METEDNIFYQSSLSKIKAIVLEALKDEDVTIILFGSAARGDFYQFSDIDIGFIPKNGYDKKKVILLKEKLENINIPYNVDLVDISKVSSVFKEKVLEEGLVWKN